MNILFDLFLTFAKIGLFTFGGGSVNSHQASGTPFNHNVDKSKLFILKTLSTGGIDS